MDIATWARKYFGKSLSLNTVHRCIKKCNLKLYYAKRKVFINFPQNRHRVIWARSPLRWIERQWKHVLWSDESIFQLVQLVRLGVHHCPWHGWSAYMRRYHWCGGWYWTFGRDISCCQDDDFSQELHVYFSRTMPALIIYKLQQCDFVGIECVCLTGLPAVQICLQLKMCGASWRGESDNGNHGLLSCPSLVYM